MIPDNKITHPKTILINLKEILSNLLKIWPENLDLFFLPESDQLPIVKYTHIKKKKKKGIDREIQTLTN